MTRKAPPPMDTHSLKFFFLEPALMIFPPFFHQPGLKDFQVRRPGDIHRAVPLENFTGPAPGQSRRNGPGYGETASGAADALNKTGKSMRVSILTSFAASRFMPCSP